MNEMKTISQRIKELKSEGYTEDFYFEDGTLNSENSRFKAADIEKIVEFRFEGKSNPDDLSILYQIITLDGTKGTIVDGFGPTGDPELAQFLLKAEP